MDRWNIELIDPFEEQVNMLDVDESYDLTSNEKLGYIENSLLTEKTKNWPESHWSIGSSAKKISNKLFPLVNQHNKTLLNGFQNSKRPSFINSKCSQNLRTGSIYNLKKKVIVSAVKRGLSLERMKRKAVNSEFGACEKEETVDWKLSTLRLSLNDELYAESGSSLVYLSDDQVFSNLDNFDTDILKNTFKKLKKELLYRKKFSVIGIKNELQRLIMVRKVVVRVLEAISIRDEIVLSILTLGKSTGQNLEKMSSEVRKLDRIILRDIEKIKNSILSIDKFIYFGEDYEEKIIHDNKMILKLTL